MDQSPLLLFLLLLVERGARIVADGSGSCSYILHARNCRNDLAEKNVVVAVVWVPEDCRCWHNWLTCTIHSIIGMPLSSTSQLSRIALCTDDLLDLVVPNCLARSTLHQTTIKYALASRTSGCSAFMVAQYLCLVRLPPDPAPNWYSCTFLL